MIGEINVELDQSPDMSQADGIQGPPNAQEEQYTVAFAFIL